MDTDRGRAKRRHVPPRKQYQFPMPVGRGSPDGTPHPTPLPSSEEGRGRRWASRASSAIPPIVIGNWYNTAGKLTFVEFPNGKGLNQPLLGSVNNHPTNRFAITVALWPPKPKELFAMASIFISRAVWGT